MNGIAGACRRVQPNPTPHPTYAAGDGAMNGTAGAYPRVQPDSRRSAQVRQAVSTTDRMNRLTIAMPAVAIKA
jgi:hypothetical protein